MVAITTETDPMEALERRVARLEALERRVGELERLIAAAGLREQQVTPLGTPAAAARVAADEAPTADVAATISPAPVVAEEVPEVPVSVAASQRTTTYADYFVRLAVLCFVLVGALVLRVVAFEGMIETSVGTSLGLAYSVLLLSTALWQNRWRWLTRHAPLLRICGVLLGVLVALESFYKSALYGPELTSVLVAALVLVGGGVAAWRRERVLGAISFGVGVVALFGLGLTWEALASRVTITLALLVAGFVVARMRGWFELRVVTLGPVLVAGGIGALMLARRLGVPAETAPAILMGTGATLAVVAASLLWPPAAPRGRVELAALPVTALWAFGLFADRALVPAAIGATALGVVAMGGARWLARLGERAAVTATVVGSTGALLAGVALPWFDPTGLGAAAAALILIWLARALGSDVVKGLALAMTFVAAAASIDRLGGSADPIGLAGAAAALAGSGLVFATYFLGRARDETSVIPWRTALSLVALASAIVMLFAALSDIAAAALGTGAALLLARTLLLGALTLGALRVGIARRLRDLRIAAYCGVLVLALKVLFVDLMTLQGAAKVAAMVTLGVTSLVVSLIMRKRA